MLRLLLPSLLAATLGVTAPFPVMGQSDETCIAYMEAEAAYGRAIKPAIVQAIRSVTATERADAEAAEAAESEAQAAYDTEPSKAQADALDKARKARQEATIALMRATTDAAIEIVDDRRVVAPASARQKRWQAYVKAYRGPTSIELRVMEKLIRADRERCRRRFE